MRKISDSIPGQSKYFRFEEKAFDSLLLGTRNARANTESFIPVDLSYMRQRAYIYIYCRASL